MESAPVVAQVVNDASGSALLSSQVELFISCRKLADMDTFSKSDPFFVVSYRENKTSPWREIKRSETIWNTLNPDFPDQIILTYHFERQQHLLIQIFDRDTNDEDLTKQDFIGSVETTVGTVMGSRGAMWKGSLTKKESSSNRGEVILRAEEISQTNDLAHFEFACSGLDRKDWFGFGRSDPFISISRSREDGTFVKVYQSETIFKNLHPHFKPFSIRTQVLCNGDLDRPLRIEVWDYNSNGSHAYIGSFVTSLRALQSGKSFTLENERIKEKKGSKYSGSGVLHVKNARIEKRHSFLEYIRGGCELNLIVAVDFTASNGAPSTPQSLHHRGTTGLNEYQKAILSIGEVLEPYDSDNLYPCYGFGGQVNGGVNHCFPLNFDESHPSVEGVRGLFDAYNNSFSFVSLSGPTLFSPILAKTKELVMQSDCTQRNQQYHILLILTDGIICDMDATIREIVHASDLPLSIIIVGVGDADFGNMVVLDADDSPLVSEGKQMARDIVQFVPFRKFNNQGYEELARETLAEIPEQLLSFMALKGIRPNPPQLSSLRQFSSIEQSQRNLIGGTTQSAASESAPFATPVDLSASATPSAPSVPPPAPNSSSVRF